MKKIIASVFILFFVLYLGLSAQTHSGRLDYEPIEPTGYVPPRTMPLWQAVHNAVGHSEETFINSEILPLNTYLLAHNLIYSSKYNGKQQYMIKDGAPLNLPTKNHQSVYSAPILQNPLSGPRYLQNISDWLNERNTLLLGIDMTNADFLLISLLCALAFAIFYFYKQRNSTNTQPATEHDSYPYNQYNPNTMTYDEIISIIKVCQEKDGEYEIYGVCKISITKTSTRKKKNEVTEKKE